METAPASWVQTWPTLNSLPTPVKMLFTVILLTLSLAMIGAFGQVIVHDVIPTFSAGGGENSSTIKESAGHSAPAAGRGDLFSEPAKAEESKKSSLMENEQFIWTLKWSHIHLFGMNMIFFFLGTVTIFLDMSTKAKSWLITLPFAGVAVDIAAIWLKGFISPVFFWLHIPGGGLFAGIFLYVLYRGMKEMWWTAGR